MLIALSIGAALAQKINIGYIYPSGAARGTSSIITIGGQSISTATGVSISGSGVTAEVIPPSAEDLAAQNKNKRKKISDEDNLQIAQKLVIKVTVAPDAELGMRDMKVIGAKGDLSNRLFFEIGEYVNFVESEPNNTFETSNKIPSLPTTICGYVEKSSVSGSTETKGGGVDIELGGKDFFEFEAKKGQTIVAETKAEVFVPYLADAVPGWFQAVISLYDESGSEVAFCDDYNLRPDPVLIYTIPKNGKYTLKIHDSIYRGREDFVYRINLGAIPYVTSIFPLGGLLDSKTSVAIKGVNLTDESMVIEPTNALDYKDTYRYKNANGHHSNEITFAAQKGKKEIIRPVGSNDKSNPTSLDLGHIINAQILEKGECHWYKIHANVGDELFIKVTGRRLGSPIDALMCIYSPSGELVAKIDDVPDDSEGMITHQADPEIVHKFKNSGDFLIRITEQQNNFGPEYSYRLSADVAKPDFSLNIEPSSISIPQSGTALFTVFVNRNGGFNQPVALKFEGLPKGYTVSDEVISPAAKYRKIAITAPKDAKLGKLNLQIFGESVGKGGEVLRHLAKPVEELKQAFYISHLLTTEAFDVDIVHAQQFYITFAPAEGSGDKIVLNPDGITPIKVILHRQEGFNEPVMISAKFKVKNVSFQGITIDGDKSEGIIMLDTKSWKPNRLWLQLMILGTVKSKAVNVAGIAKNTVISSVMVNSPFIEIDFPSEMNIPFPYFMREGWFDKLINQAKAKGSNATKQYDNKNQQSRIEAAKKSQTQTK